MRFSRNSIYKIVLATVCFMIIAEAPPLFAQSPALDELKERFETGSVFSADFTHLLMDSFTGEETTTRGKIWIGENSYRIEADNQIMVVDGELSRVYNSARNRLIISRYIEDEDDYAPSRMLQGVDESYSVKQIEIQGGGTIIELASDDPFSVFSEVSIILDESSLPFEINATDQAGNSLTTSFSNGKFISYSDRNRIFEIQVPESAEVIDLRHENQ